jgi:hypothetical protein
MKSSNFLVDLGSSFRAYWASCEVTEVEETWVSLDPY